ncbi:MAG: NERD domain-containing protein [Ruminococcus sp.]|nr:NERD domain-containing protein [Ruminococcus sp.]
MMFSDIFKNLFDEKKSVGRKGERLTGDILKSSDISGRILKNLYVPTNNGETSEIDMIYITRKGILVIESKNYSGSVSGKIQDTLWVQKFPNGTENTFYNPVMQNAAHIKYLEDFLKYEIPMFSFIVFSDKCSLKKFRPSKSTFIVKRDGLTAAMDNVMRNNEDFISDSEINSIFSQLKPLTKVKKSVKKAHVENINRKYNSDSPECPLCGSKLVLRTASKGSHKGEKFYGCSAYPKCRYITEVIK